MTPQEVSVVIPTRGDVPMDEILDSLQTAGFEDIVVWDNSQRDDMGIYGRYAAIAEARNAVIATQDDDVIVNCWPELLAAYKPNTLTVNYQEPWDIPWCARGGIFHMDLPDAAFAGYVAEYGFDSLFTHWICDAVFGLLTANVNVLDLDSTDLPHGFEHGRVSTSPGWYDNRRLEAQRRCQALRQAA